MIVREREKPKSLLGFAAKIRGPGGKSNCRSARTRKALQARLLRASEVPKGKEGQEGRSTTCWTASNEQTQLQGTSWRASKVA